MFLSEGLKVLQTWNTACVSLTETYWPNYALHSWSGKPYVPQFCVNFQKRLKEVSFILYQLWSADLFASTSAKSSLLKNRRNINHWSRCSDLAVISRYRRAQLLLFNNIRMNTLITYFLNHSPLKEVKV